MLDDNVKRGSRVFEKGHVRPTPGTPAVPRVRPPGPGATMRMAGIDACPAGRSGRSKHQHRHGVPGNVTCDKKLSMERAAAVQRARLTPAPAARAQVLLLGWCDSQRDLEVVQKVVSQLCHAYEAEGGRVIVVMTQRAKLELEALFRRILPPAQRFGSQLVFRQARAGARARAAAPALRVVCNAMQSMQLLRRSSLSQPLCKA